MTTGFSKNPVKYQFFTNHRYSIRMLICPNCMKRLQRYDIEEFMSCPYCNYQFEHNADLEGFMLQPLINEWMKQYTHSPFQNPGDR